MEAKALRKYLDRVATHMSSDLTRFHLVGALVEADGRTVAADGHRLLDLGPGSFPGDFMPTATRRDMFLPGAWVNAALAALRGEDGQVRLCVVGDEVQRVELWPGKSGLCVSASTDFDGDFPPWRQVMPKKDRRGALRAWVNRRKLAALVRETTPSEPVRLTLNDGGLFVEVEEMDTAKREKWRGAGSCPLLNENDKPIDAGAKFFGGSERVVGLQAGYVLDAIAVPDQVIEVDVGKEELDPVVFSGENWRVVVMPWRLK